MEGPTEHVGARSQGRAPWRPDLAGRAGRQALEARIARAPAVLVAPGEVGSGTPDRWPPRQPRLVVGVELAGAATLVTLDHVVRPDAASQELLRRRLALLRFADPCDPRAEAAVRAWSALAREHTALERERARGLTRARRLARELRP